MQYMMHLDNFMEDTMMDNEIDSISESTKLPQNRPWMDNVIRILINGIPEDCYELCQDIVPENNLQENSQYLKEFVQERLLTLAEREYKLWINGRMPYITPRELQLWRLRQFVQYIWFWNLPDDNDLAMIFNTTKRKASNLINDFIARFRKTLLFPVSIRRLYKVLEDEPVMEDKPHREKPNVIGNIYELINRRYLDDCNMLINEIRIRLPNNQPISDSYFHNKEILQIWVEQSVVKLIKDNNDIIRDIFNTYPMPEQDNE